MITKIFSSLLFSALFLVLTACRAPAGSPAGTEPPAGTEAAERDIAGAQTEAAQPASLSIGYADDALLAQPDACERFSVTQSEWTVNAVLSTDVPVTDFKVLSIAMEGIDDDGTMSFRVSEELYSLNELSPEKPLVLGVEFAGMVPDTGISYRDTDGTEQFFALSMSGENEDLLLQKAELLLNP